jgi:ParB-like chromosome segregation protein Spo0J
MMREVHPVAELFPMLAADELDELASDIQERGLLQPIMLDVEGRVLDGRNRLAACELIGLEPAFMTYDGDDPGGYALAVNIARRHLTKGQQAMVAARAALVSKGTKAAAARSAGVSAGRVSQAVAVLDHAPDLADGVVSGAVSLDTAYETARKNKKVAEGTEAQMARLRENAPDLADHVTEERMNLAEAIAGLDERERKQAERQRDARALLARIVDLIAPSTASDGFIESWADHLGGPDDELDQLITRSGEAVDLLTDLRYILLKKRADR